MDSPAGDNGATMHSGYSTQPDSPKTVQGTLDTPTTGTHLEGRARSSATDESDTFQGKFPTGNPLKSPVDSGN